MDNKKWIKEKILNFIVFIEDNLKHMIKDDKQTDFEMFIELLKSDYSLKFLSNYVITLKEDKIFYYENVDNSFCRRLGVNYEDISTSFLDKLHRYYDLFCDIF